MKKTNKPNPLKFFNDNNAAAYKKAGGAMKAYKKSLKKAQEGVEMNIKKDKPWEGPVELTNVYDVEKPSYIKPSSDYSNYGSSLQAKAKDFPQGVPSIAKPYMERSIEKNKKGGSVKRKK
jgi:hypothetical protein